MSEFMAVFGDWATATISVRPYLGDGADGPSRGPWQDVENVWVRYADSIALQTDGTERRSDAIIRGDLPLAPLLAAGGLVRLPDGRERTILSCVPNDVADMPSHVKAILV